MAYRSTRPFFSASIAGDAAILNKHFFNLAILPDFMTDVFATISRVIIKIIIMNILLLLRDYLVQFVQLRAL